MATAPLSRSDSTHDSLQVLALVSVSGLVTALTLAAALTLGPALVSGPTLGSGSTLVSGFGLVSESGLVLVSVVSESRLTLRTAVTLVSGLVPSWTVELHDRDGGGNGQIDADVLLCVCGNKQSDAGTDPERKLQGRSARY